MIRKLPKQQRAKKRGSISLPVSYTNLSADPEEEQNKKGRGTTADLSKDGIGVYADRELKPGAILEIECRDIWDGPRQFTVRWCDRIQFNFYRLGLEARK